MRYPQAAHQRTSDAVSANTMIEVKRSQGQLALLFGTVLSNLHHDMWRHNAENGIAVVDVKHRIVSFAGRYCGERGDPIKKRPGINAWRPGVTRSPAAPAGSHPRALPGPPRSCSTRPTRRPRSA